MGGLGIEVYIIYVNRGLFVSKIRGLFVLVWGGKYFLVRYYIFGVLVGICVVCDCGVWWLFGLFCFFWWLCCWVSG